nr:VanZ family protein [Parashewanella hymeniacidonis]
MLVVTVLIISYLVFSRPGYNQSFPHIDKIGHMGSFFLLSALTHLAFKPKWWRLMSGLIAYAGLIEVVQSYLPYRSASWADFGADILGIVCFYLLLLGYRKQRSS